MAIKPTGMNDAGMLKKMMYNPMHQKVAQRAQMAEGMDNKAVSGMGRTLGKMVAGERKRLMSLEEAGADLAMRKDKLAFSKKIHSQQIEMQKERMKMKEDAEGKEFVLGLASTAVTGFGEYQNYKRDKQYKADRALHWRNMEFLTGKRPEFSDTYYDLDYGGPNN